MLTLFNDILGFYVLPGLILAFGLCFLFILVPQVQGLNSYRMARHMMGGAYLLFFAALVAEAVGMKMEMLPLVHQMLMLTISIAQAFLFTFALTTLVDVQFFSWRRFWREVLIIIVPAAAAFASIPFVSDHPSLLVRRSSFLLLVLFYGYKIIDYIALFRRRYSDYERRMSDYYSDDERRRLFWVKRSFISALFIGVLAMLYAFYPNVLTNLLFSLVLVIYYGAFALRFINYAFTFQRIEAAMESELFAPSSDHEQSDESFRIPDSSEGIGDEALMKRLSELMTSRKLYVKTDLTIEEVAVLAGESHRAVSAAINSHESTNFKSWVNGYRIAAAERLIKEGYLEHHTTDALAAAVGFANRISFYRVFKKATGSSPTDYR